MITTHLRDHVLFFGAVSASLAMVAPGISAQPRPTPERPLSDAMAEALLSPFHGYHEPPGSPGRDLLLSSTAPPLELSGGVGVAASPAQQPPGARIPAPAGAPSAEDGSPSRGKVFLLTTLTAAAGHAWSLYWPVLCNPGDPPLVNPVAATGEDALCPTKNEAVLFLTGGLATVMMTGGAAKLAGRGFWRSLAGSALGYAGGLTAAYGLGRTSAELGWESGVNPVAMGGLILGHSALTTLLFN